MVAMKRKNDHQKLSAPRKRIKFSDLEKVAKQHESTLAKKIRKFKVPGLDEITKINEPRSNVFFKLQLDGILDEISVSEKEIVKMTSWFNKFATVLKSLSPSKAVKFQNFAWTQKQKLHVPFDLTKFNNVENEFLFEPPTDVSKFGSFASRTSLKQERTIDVMLTLSRNVISKQDFDNGVWFVKRALYLSCIAKALEQNESCSNMNWMLQFDNPLRPVLQIRPSGDCSKWTINLFPVPPADKIKFAQSGPLRNNIDPSWFFNKKLTEDCKKTPTPLFNWLLGIDLLMKNHHEYISNHLDHDNVRQTIKLLKVWTRQRKYNQVNGYLSGHIWTMYVLYLLDIRKLSREMSPFQMFRSTLLKLSKDTWVSDGPSFLKQWNREYEKSDFHKHAEVVFVGPSGYINLTKPWLADTFEEIQLDCANTAQLLSDIDSSTFNSVFIQNIDLLQKYDEIICIKLSSLDIKNTLEKCDDKSISYLLNHFGQCPRKVWLQIIDILKKGMEKRLKRATLFKTPVRSFEYKEEVPPMNNNLMICLMYNDSYTELLSKGPTGDSAEAGEFRNFWGDICKLRRFKDGTFHEAVLWGESGDPLFIRRRIPLKITKHLIKKYFDIDQKLITSGEEMFEAILQSPMTVANCKTGSGEELHSSCIISFDAFTRKLQSLKLPLKITKTVSTSAAMRHSAVFTPVPLPWDSVNEDVSVQSNKLIKPEFSCYREPIDIIIFFEFSGKWPNDLDALKAVKVEFMCVIADELEKETIPSNVYNEYMDIFWNGYVYRLKIGHRREIYLLREMNKTLSADEITQDAMQLEMNIELLPKLTSYLNRLQSSNSSYSCTVRLAKRWISCQLLSPYFPPIVVELLVAYTFMSNATYQPTLSSKANFIKFLNLLAKFDWMSTPIILNFENNLTVNDIDKVTELFNSEREKFPSIFICTSCEMKSILSDIIATQDMESEQINARLEFSKMLTQNAPILPIVARAKLLATAALDVIYENFIGSHLDVKTLFRPSLNDFNVIINITNHSMCRRHEAIDVTKTSSYKEYKKSKGENVPMVNFDPVKNFVEELRVNYGDHALFLHDEFGGSSICVVWKPAALESKPFDPQALRGHKLHTVNFKEQILNMEAIIQDFKIMGASVIKSINLKDM